METKKTYTYEKFGRIEVKWQREPDPTMDRGPKLLYGIWKFYNEAGALINAHSPWDDYAAYPPSEAQVLGWLIGEEVISGSVIACGASQQ